MPQYMLLIYNDVEADRVRRAGGGHPEEYQQWKTLERDLREAGLLVANNGLAPAESATTVRAPDGETQITDGPFAETKEILAGYFLIEASDLDQALEYASRVPNLAYGAVEVRPLYG